MKTSAGKFICNIVAAGDADIIAGHNLIRLAHADTEGTSAAQRGNRRVGRIYAHHDLIARAETAPGSIHTLRRAVFVVSSDDEHRFWINTWLNAKTFSHE